MNSTNINSKYLLTVRNSKAIRSADIGLDSITVLAGVNASGKSTLARMMHEIVNLSAIYSLLLERYAWRPVRSWATAIVELEGRLSGQLSGLLSAYGVQESVLQFESKLGKGAFGEVLTSLDVFTRKTFGKYQEQMGRGDAKRAFTAFVRSSGVGEELAGDVQKVYAVFAEKQKKALGEYDAALSQRQYVVYNSAQDMKYDLRWLTDADAVSFYEDGEPVYAVHRNSGEQSLSPDCELKEIFGVHHSFYIASPWVGIPKIENGVLTIRYDDFPHFPANSEKIDDDLFDVMGGKVELDESSGTKRWMFRRSDGLSIDLTDCATGIKALSILNILYKNGYLDAETLLIIDEPEAHLHPQWIIAYARILVLIAKRLKVRMLLTSHSPDMVSAIQEISQCEGLSGVRFYLAENNPGELQYQYRDLGDDVEPIFAAFNKAIDDLELYGGESGARFE